MANIVIRSEDIDVYPNNLRVDTKPYVNLYTEENIIKPHNSITDINSYVIEGLTLDSYETSNNRIMCRINPGKFVMYGYQFTLNKAAYLDITNSVQNLGNYGHKYYIFLKVFISTTANLLHLPEISCEQGYITDNTFPGISILSEYYNTLSDNKVIFDPDDPKELKLGYILRVPVDSYEVISDPVYSRFSTNKMRINLVDSSLSTTTYPSKSFEDFLNDNFILDDGEI